MRVLTLMLLLFPCLASAQMQVTEPAPGKELHYYFTLYSQADGKLAPSVDPIKEFLLKIDSRKRTFKSEKAFLRHIFHKTQLRFLDLFQPHASFGELITTGKYSCLSATALYALLLEHYGFDFTIIETNYHIFILAHTKQGPVLLESTNGEHGFIDDPRTIERMMEEYRKQKVGTVSNSKHYFQYSLSRADTVSLTGMLGLLHYNHAVEAYNGQNLKAAITHLHHALLLHRSAKLDAFLNLLITTVNHSSKLEKATKEKYLVRLENLQVKRNIPVTSLMIPLIR